MDLSAVLSRAQRGIDAPLVRVETHISNGIPAFTIVGLPATAVKESRERVRSAIINSRFVWPEARLTINLAPADLPKDGGRYDLPIALGVLAATGQIPEAALAEREFIGELALDGKLRAVVGSVSAAVAASRDRRALILPEANAANAALVPGSRIIPVRHLLEVSAWLHGRESIGFAAAPEVPHTADYPDISEVQGQEMGKRALEIAATGGHNLLMSGPPGTGKTMLAMRLPGLLPPLQQTEMLEVLSVRSAVDPCLSAASCRQRPFRAPHHSASAGALVGGGGNPRPGEISLAHHGVLFLDELPEFPRHVLEVMRQPLETGEVTISRALLKATFPARFQLLAAMNPCPCGYDGDRQIACECTTEQIRRYRRRVSGPLLDRIDILINLPRIRAHELHSAPRGEESAAVRERVCGARERALARGGCTNARLSAQAIARDCELAPEDRALLDGAVDRLGLSARRYHRILRVARTIADLADEPRIARPHLIESLGYQQVDLPG